MAVSKKTVEEATKPVTPLEMAKSGYEAQRLSTQIQKQFGRGDQPIVKPSAFRTAGASLPARQAEFQRRQEFIPKVYETVGAVEERQTKAADDAAKFYQEWGLRADELAMKQSQAEKEAGLAQQQIMQDTESKLRDIEFSAFKNDAQRQDALEKAYLDGQADYQILKAGVTGQVRMADIEKYWDMQINELNEYIKDYEAWTEHNIAAFKEDVAAKAKNWGTIISGLTDLTKVGVDEMGKEDEAGYTGWDKLNEKLFGPEEQPLPSGGR